MQLHRASSWLLLATTLGACSGRLDSGPGRPHTEAAVVARVVTRPLTPAELDFALSDLVGASTHAAMRLQPSSLRLGIETLPSDELRLSGPRSDALIDVLYDVALDATEHHAPLRDCVANTGEACVETVLSSLARHAYRRAWTPAESSRVLAVARQLESTHGRREAVARALQALLLSPAFLYLTSIGDGGPELSGAELAARMAFFTWATLPDEALLEAAQRGELATEEGRARAVDRLLADPRAGRAVTRFVLGWSGILDLPATAKSDPAWTPALAGDALRESGLFVSDWFRGDDRSFAALFDTDHGFATEGLAAFYGWTIPGSAARSDGFARVEGTARSGRVGLLTQAAFLAAHARPSASSPVLRGKWFIERALCQSLGSPPMDANSRAPAVRPAMQTREWHEAIAATDGCTTCHDRMNPPGYAFEAYDAVGRLRSLEHERPVRTDAILTTDSDMDGAYRGAIDFSEAVGQSRDVRQCFATHWVRYALGRSTGPSERVLVQRVGDALESDAREAARLILLSPSFRTAKAPREGS